MAREPTLPLTHAATLRAGAALVVNSGSNSILGILYWVIAARSLTPDEVGRGSTLLSTLVVVSGLAQLNYSRRLPYLIPRASPNGTRMLARAYVRTLLASGLLAGACWLLLRVVQPANMATLHLPGGAVFVLGTMLWSIFALQDAALTAFRLTVAIPVENTLFGLLKIVALLALPLSGLSGTWIILLSWLAPLLLLVIAINYLIFNRHSAERTEEFLPRPHISNGVTDALGSYSILLSPLILQYVVLTSLGATSTAVLFIPLVLAASADALSGNIGNAITAEVTRNEGRVTPQIQRLVSYLLGAAAGGALLTLAVGRPVLQLFGESYSKSSLTLLIFFGFAAAARAAVFCSAAVQRARGKAARAMLLQSTVALGPLLAAALIELELIGLTGIAGIWLATSLAAAALSLAYARLSHSRTASALE